jgi:hypothetical protein
MRASKLIDFFIALGDDPEVAKQFHKDPNAAMDAAGLSEKEKELVLRGDQEEVRAALGPEYRDISLHTAPKGVAAGAGQPTDTHSTHSPGEPYDDLTGGGRGQTPDTHSNNYPGEPHDDATGGGRGQTPDTHSNNYPGEPHDDAGDDEPPKQT